MNQEQMNKWLLRASAIGFALGFACLGIIKSLAADDHRIHPECVEATDANGKPYRSCHVNHGPSSGPNVVPVPQSRTEVKPNTVVRPNNPRPDIAPPPPPVAMNPRAGAVTPPPQGGQMMPPRIFFTPGGPIVVQLPFGRFQFQW